MHGCIGPTCDSGECQGAELRAAALVREGELEWLWIVRALRGSTWKPSSGNIGKRRE